MISRTVLICLTLFYFNQASAAYTISGKVNLSDEWQPQIFLAAIDKLDDYYNAYPDLIVDAAHINPDGTFLLEGSSLPPEKKFYRLYMMKEQNSEFDACLYVGGDDHNFIHVILDQNAKLRINSDPTTKAPFGNYKVEGDYDNDMMRSLARLVYPSFYFYQIKFPSELRFSQEKLNRDLFAFSDTCQSTMASLAAVVNTDMDKYHSSNSAFYQSFANRLKTDLGDNSYTQDFDRKLRYYNPKMSEESPWKNIILLIAGAISLLLFFQNMKLRKELGNKSKTTQSEKTQIDQLTNKEIEILNLITTGKSNKEIASELFVELSTVKTHINKIYSKLHLTNRKDAIKIGKSLSS